MKNLLLALPLLALATASQAQLGTLPLGAFIAGQAGGLLSDIPLQQESVPDDTYGPLTENQCWASQCAQKAADRSAAAGFSAMATLPPDGTQWKDPACNTPPCALKDGPEVPAHEAAIVPAPNGGFVVANDKGVTVVDRRGRPDAEATRRLKEEQERMAREQREAQDRGFNPNGMFGTPPGSTARGGGTPPPVPGADIGEMFANLGNYGATGGNDGPTPGSSGGLTGETPDVPRKIATTWDTVLANTSGLESLNRDVVRKALPRAQAAANALSAGEVDAGGASGDDAITPACATNSLANGTCINNN